MTVETVECVVASTVVPESTADADPSASNNCSNDGTQLNGVCARVHVS